MLLPLSLMECSPQETAVVAWQRKLVDKKKHTKQEEEKVTNDAAEEEAPMEDKAEKVTVKIAR